jgi:hypothetical protein
MRIAKPTKPLIHVSAVCVRWLASWYCQHMRNSMHIYHEEGRIQEHHPFTSRSKRSFWLYYLATLLYSQKWDDIWLYGSAVWLRAMMQGFTWGYAWDTKTHWSVPWHLLGFRSFTVVAVMLPSAVVARLVVDAHIAGCTMHAMLQEGSFQVVGFGCPLFFSSFQVVRATQGLALLCKACSLLKIERVTGRRLWHRWRANHNVNTCTFVCVT